MCALINTANVHSEWIKTPFGDTIFSFTSLTLNHFQGQKRRYKLQHNKSYHPTVKLRTTYHHKVKIRTGRT